MVDILRHLPHPTRRRSYQDEIFRLAIFPNWTLVAQLQFKLMQTRSFEIANAGTSRFAALEFQSLKRREMGASQKRHEISALDQRLLIESLTTSERAVDGLQLAVQEYKAECAIFSKCTSNSVLPIGFCVTFVRLSVDRFRTGARDTDLAWFPMDK